MHEGCNCHRQPTRRNILQGGIAATVLAAGAQRAAAQGASSPAGLRAIDTHAHYYPQPYLDLIASEGPRFKYEVTITDEAFAIRTPSFSPGPLPKKFVDIKQRLADMDSQGVGVQALSLTQPMVYLPDANFSHRLAMTWNRFRSGTRRTLTSKLRFSGSRPCIWSHPHGTRTLLW